MQPSTSKPRARLLRFFVRAGVSLAFIAVALVIFNALKNSRPSAEQVESTARPRPVRTVTATPAEIPRWWVGYASVDPINAADIAAEITAVVLERPAWLRSGAAVEKDQLILTLDASDYDARLAQAHAAIGAIEANLDALDTETESLDEQITFARESVDLLRWEIDQLVEARKVGASSEAEVERLRRQLAGARGSEEALQERRRSIPSRRALLRSNLTGAHADRDIAELNVRRCSIRAPFAGVIEFVSADTGERVNAGQTLLRIVDPNHLEIPVRIPASAATEIAVGAIAQITPTSANATMTESRVARLSPQADPATRTITVFIEIEQDASRRLLLPGQFVRARVRSSTIETASLVPRSAIDNDRVFVINKETSRAEPRDVTIAFYVNNDHPELDEHETQWAAVVSGLEPGDAVITSNLDEIVSGILVQSLEAGENSGAEGDVDGVEGKKSVEDEGARE